MVSNRELIVNPIKTKYRSAELLPKIVSNKRKKLYPKTLKNTKRATLIARNCWLILTTIGGLGANLRSCLVVIGVSDGGGNSVTS
jgi:hypothetical protein